MAKKWKDRIDLGRYSLDNFEYIRGHDDSLPFYAHLVNHPRSIDRELKNSG